MRARSTLGADTSLQAEASTQSSTLRDESTVQDDSGTQSSLIGEGAEGYRHDEMSSDTIAAAADLSVLNHLFPGPDEPLSPTWDAVPWQANSFEAMLQGLWNDPIGEPAPEPVPALLEEPSYHINANVSESALLAIINVTMPVRPLILGTSLTFRS